VPTSGGFWSWLGLGGRNADWPNNEIDHFVLKKLKEHDLSPALEADRATLIRRVSLYLTGLPPTEKEARDFVNDTSENARSTRRSPPVDQHAEYAQNRGSTG